MVDNFQMKSDGTFERLEINTFKRLEINKEELLKLYMKWVNKVSEECDWKTSFGAEEIVYSIANILETNPQLINNEVTN